jgi:peptidoglycan/xylan/chitin deacetylase (PgdA/CDA1 family)
VGAVDFISAVARDPMQGWYRVMSKVAPHRLIDRSARLGRQNGLKRPVFVLSFDCDTDQDIAVTPQVHERLKTIGITPIYAVPGALLERGAQMWREIAAAGAEFINHGYLTHTTFSDGRYVSNLFYDMMSPTQIEEDIRKGDASARAVLGRAPEGFRVPHFGTFDSDAQIRLVHRILSRLGYRFSTSTSPYVGLRHGPITNRYGLPEIPLSGCVDYPLVILDSYTFRFSGGPFRGEDYIKQAKAWSERLEQGGSYVLNLYADPSQVADWPEFFSAMERLAPFARTTYRAVLDEIAS